MHARVAKKKNTKPISLKIDKSKSTRLIIRGLIDAAFVRQKEYPGSMIADALMQHLVRAKLQLAHPSAKIERKVFSVADATEGNGCCFLIGDTAIHVTAAPTERLIRTCQGNLSNSIQPVIITTDSGVGGAHALARDAAIADRIDVLEIEQFVTTNVYEWSGFMQAKRPLKVAELIEVYNQIIDSCETDPSLKILIV